MEIRLRPFQFEHSAISESRPAHRDALSISLLGGISVAFKGRDVRIRSRKSRAVLAFLALRENQQETRERLVGLLWSESEEDKARASLRQTLRELRQALSEAGYSGLQTEKLAIELDPGSLEVDLWSVVHAAEAGRAHPLVLNTPRLAERLLAGFEDIDPEFRVWLLAKRQTFHERLMRALEAGLIDSGSGTQNRKLLAEAIMSLDPTHEDACRHLMQARAEEGDISGALRAYKSLWDLLDEEYDMEPSARTQRLVAEIKQGSVERAPVSSSAPGAATIRVEPSQPELTPGNTSAPRKIALVVSQFQVNGVTPDKIHLVQGFRHHLIASLIRFREWGVVDDVAPRSRDEQQASRTPRYGIDATAYQTGDRVHIVLTLRPNETGVFVWSESFELKLENWFDVQQRIIRRITSSLNVQLSAERLATLAPEPDVSLEIYDRWLRGQSMILRFSPDDWKRAVDIFTKAIRDAPGFSPSFSSLVQLNNTVHFVYPGKFRDLSTTDRTIELARTAIRLDPVDSRAQLCTGWSLTLANRHADAEVHMELACELNHNDPWTLMSAALYHAFCGNRDRAGQLAEEASALSISPGPEFLGYLAVIQFLCDNYEGVLSSTSRPDSITRIMPAWRAAALHHLGRRDESVGEARRFLGGVRSAWHGEAPPTDINIARWLLHAYPIRRPEDWQRLRDGVLGAGIPVSGLEHGRW